MTVQKENGSPDTTRLTTGEVKHFGNGLWVGVMCGLVLAMALNWLAEGFGKALALWL